MNCSVSFKFTTCGDIHGATSGVSSHGGHEMSSHGATCGDMHGATSCVSSHGGHEMSSHGEDAIPSHGGQSSGGKIGNASRDFVLILTTCKGESDNRNYKYVV